jgi:hypothetical protein
VHTVWLNLIPYKTGCNFVVETSRRSTYLTLTSFVSRSTLPTCQGMVPTKSRLTDPGRDLGISPFNSHEGHFSQTDGKPSEFLPDARPRLASQHIHWLPQQNKLASSSSGFFFKNCLKRDTHCLQIISDRIVDARVKKSLYGVSSLIYVSLRLGSSSSAL